MRAPLLLVLASCVHGAPLLPKPLSSMEMSWVGSDMLISPRSDGESDNGAPVGEDEAARHVYARWFALSQRAWTMVFLDVARPYASFASE